MPEKPLAAGDLAKRDATYAPTDDLPEAGVPEPPPETPSTEPTPAPAVVAAQPDQRPTIVETVAQALGVQTEPSPPSQPMAANAH
jgi:hypothetical protein